MRPIAATPCARCLQACPAIRGVTIRTHGESGVPEGEYELWRKIFDGAAQCGRRVEIDLHAKGMNQQMIDTALGTGLPVNISPKFWAEHMGLPYMQGAIRALEMPPHRSAPKTGFFALSTGSRSFMRYGYGDLLTEDRRYGVLHRIWPGTQRMLLWGDPEMAADYGRVSSFCGSQGVELFEPLVIQRPQRFGPARRTQCLCRPLVASRRAGISKSYPTLTASGAGISTIPMANPRLARECSASNSAEARKKWKRPWPRPAGFCRW